MLDLNLFIAVIGCVVAVVSFFVGRQMAIKNEGKEAGSFSTDLKYIKESVNRIESRLERDIGRVGGRVDEISNQLASTNAIAARALEAAKSAHKRQDEHLERDHEKTLVYHETT